MGVTIRQVARAAGVSVATVSRVLNGHDRVRKSTRLKVLEAAAALDYVPHSAARSLITRVTHAVAVILPDVHGEFFSELMRGVDLAARRRNYRVLLSGSHSDPGEMDAVVRATRGWVDGLILMSPEVDAEMIAATIPTSTPVVLLNRAVTDGRFECITVDNYGGALAMTRHLREAGHRRIAFVRGPAGNHDANERLRGYRDGLGGEPELLIDGDFGEESGYRAGVVAASMDPRPDAVFAANDSMAIGVLAASRDAGLEVPAEVAVTGFDDIPMARYLSPPLTTVHVAIDELGSRALQTLLAFIESPERHPGRSHTLPATLVVRSSCGFEGGIATEPTPSRNPTVPTRRFRDPAADAPDKTSGTFSEGRNEECNGRRDA